MESFHEYIKEYRKQLEKGDIKKAYKGLMEYFASLRLYLKNKYPDHFISSSIQAGYLDFTYFYFFPKSLKEWQLKIVVIFIHDNFTFEVWLSGYNKIIETKYRALFAKKQWRKYHIAPTTEGIEYVIKHLLIGHPDFSNLDALTRQIEKGIRQYPEHLESLIHLLCISRHLERIADYATNIAEDVIYMIQGDIIRHQAEKYNSP